MRTPCTVGRRMLETGQALRRGRRLLGRGRGATMARWGVVSGEGRRGVRGVERWVALGGERRQ